MDYFKHDVVQSLATLRDAVSRIRADIAEGPVRWKDDEVGTAQEHWASWALQSARRASRAISVLDHPARHVLMTADEVAEVDAVRHEVAEASARLTGSGARLLPGDLPPT
ncbi:hypothetical protein [Kribbella sp. NPDC048928]|uniref:hypothetical protein n=1 Tax=Kribbella sp. NPDC048928 TaxID=3364111 RepID=UPI00371AA426